MGPVISGVGSAAKWLGRFTASKIADVGRAILIVIGYIAFAGFVSYALYKCWTEKRPLFGMPRLAEEEIREISLLELELKEIHNSSPPWKQLKCSTL